MENGKSFTPEAMVIIQDSDEFMRDLLAALDKRNDKANTEPMDELLSAKQVMDELHISPKKFQIMRNERRIKFVQEGRKIYVKRSDLNAYIEKHVINSK